MAARGVQTARAPLRSEAARRWAWLALAAAAALPSLGEVPLAVAVTIAPQAWLVEQIGGEAVAVTTLVGPGESPETYLPADRQVSALMRSTVYFRIGVPCERGPWFDAVARAGRVKVVDLRRGVELRPLPRHLHGRDEGRTAIAAPVFEDPHVWLSPRRLRIMAGTIAETLAEVDRDAAGTYRRRLVGLEARLDRLDAELTDLLAPLAGRAFMVFHPSWGYLASDFSLRQLAIEIEGKQPSDAELTQLVTLARRESVSVIFGQPQIQGRSAEVVAAAIGGRVEILDPLAADVDANLRRAAGRIAAALRAP